MKSLHMIAWILLLVGGLNWGLTAVGYNVVEMLLGAWPMLVQGIYLLVGLSALYMLFNKKMM